MKSDFEIHSVQCDLPSSRFDFATLLRVFIKDRVGIVDVNIEAALTINLRHIFEASVGTADRQMAHRERSLGSRSLRDQFIIGPAGAGEQDSAAAARKLLEAPIYSLAAGAIG